MAKVYLDANVFIDLCERKTRTDLSLLTGHAVYVSPLTLHILIYVYKYKLPNDFLQKLMKSFTLVSIDHLISTQSLVGPTPDFEDNIQLHSAAMVEADIFLTHDKQLQKLAFFGKTKILESLE